MEKEEGPGEEYTGGDDVLTEEEDAGEAEPTPEQQMIDNARDLLGLNETTTGTPKDGFVSKVFRPLATAPLYPVQLVQVFNRGIHNSLYSLNIELIE